VGVLRNILVGCTKTREIKKVTTSQDDDFVGACNLAVWMCRFGLVTSMLVLVAVVAALIPTRAAVSVDPIVALRCD
jgi:ABC-type lipoprotein release transport system permease subunit